MKVETNKRNNLPVFKIDDSDAPGIMHLKQMIGGKFMCGKCGTENDNTAWNVLQGYFTSMRLWIEEMGKSHAQSRAKKDLCSNDFSILTGFDIAIGLPEKVISMSKKMDEIQAEKFKEAQDAIRGTDDDTD